MELFEVVLILATLLCGLVAGFLFGFAVVAMPGLGTLDDRGFLSSFRAMDRIIQNGQAVFMVVWVGSIAAVIASLVVGWSQLDGTARLLLGGAVVIYLAGVQMPTAVFNVPLNNEIQAIDPQSMTERGLAAAREAFEQRWNRWNAIRTVMAVTTTVILLVVGSFS